MDHPYIRKSDLCPLCDSLKGVGMIACWPCYRNADLRNGNATAEAMFDRREQALKDEAHESKEAGTLAAQIADDVRLTDDYEDFVP